MKKDIQIYSELNDIITSLTGAIGIISIDEVGEVSTIITDSVTIFDNLGETIVLTSGMIVTLDGINYPVSNIVNKPGTKSFDITATGLTSTEWNVAANFKTAAKKEVNQILQKDSSNLDRFPLIWLLPPKDQDNIQNVLDFTVTITLVFAHKSNATDRSAKRIEENISPVIQPLVTLFNKWLTSSDFNYMLEFFGKGKPVNYKDTKWTPASENDKQLIASVSTDAIFVTMDLNFKKQQLQIDGGTRSQFKLLTGGFLLLLE